MRISSDPDHPDYHESAAALCRIYLAGAERCNVISADEEGRRATTWRLDEFGRVRLGKDGQPLTDTFMGDVRIDAAMYIRIQRERIEAGEPAPAHPNLWPFP